MTEPNMEREISEIRRLVEVGFANTSGQLDIIRERQEHAAARHAEVAARVEKHDDRLDLIERQSATRAELEQAVGVVDARMQQIKSDVDAKLTAQEQERSEERRASKNASRTAAWSAGITLSVALLLLLLQLALRSKGAA